MTFCLSYPLSTDGRALRLLRGFNVVQDVVMAGGINSETKLHFSKDYLLIFLIH